MTPKRTPRDFVDSPCPPGTEHDIRVSATTCGKCGVALCELCQSDQHFVSDGHDLSHPSLWGV